MESTDRTNPKRKSVLSRIERLEDAITKGREYLVSGNHADWTGFRALFTPKMKDGKLVPPHKDWVRNVYLPRQERALKKACQILERLES